MAKMEDVLDVYARPYDPQTPVVGVDEKSKELHAEVRASIVAHCGQARKQDSEYHREGTTNLFRAPGSQSDGAAVQRGLCRSAA